MKIIMIVLVVFIILSFIESLIFKRKATFTIYFGVPGSGKSTMAAYLAKKAFKKKNTVYSNVAIKGAYEIKKSDIGNYDISDGLLILDEAGLDYNNRNYKKFTDEETDFFKKHRHYNVDVALFSQDFEDMDIKLRKLCTTYFLMKKSIVPFFIERRRIDKKIGIDKETKQIIEQYSFAFLGRRLIFAPSTWKFFETHERKLLPKKVFRKYE